jgi:hypothetical protein
MTIVRPGPKLEIVARNELGEETYASPAISDAQIFLRGAQHLYCIRPARPRRTAADRAKRGAVQV